MKKNLFYSTIILFVTFISLQKDVLAQGPPGAIYSYGINLTQFADRICNLSTPAPFGIVLRDSTLVLGDTVEFTFYFGDGDSAIYSGIADTSEFIELMPSAYNHLYSASGIYNLTAMAHNLNSGIYTYSQRFLTYYMGVDCGQVSGRVFNDCDLNCIMNGNEKKFSNIKVIIQGLNNSVFDSTYTNNSGFYSFNMQVGNTYSIKLEASDDLILNYVCQPTGTYDGTIMGNNDIANLGVKVDTVYDLIANTGGAFARPGSIVQIALRTTNVSCDPIGGAYSDLQINSPLLTFVSSPSSIPTSSTSNSANWSGYTLNANGTKIIWVEMMVDSTAQLGDTLCFTYTVGPDTNNIANNQKEMCLIVRNSFDPNEKEVMPVGSGVEGYVPENTEFTYTIHFQNVGNASANTVTITDSIDNNLDISTLKVINSSHEYYTQFSDVAVKFIYNQINLVDSGTNLLESNGSITYKIKAKPNLGSGIEIKNKAYIKFDNNPSIVTNTTLNTTELITSINANSVEKNVQVYPNPSEGMVKIVANNVIQSCRILDFTGRVALEKQAQQSKTMDLDLSSLKAGIYFIQTLNQDKVTSQTKWIKK